MKLCDVIFKIYFSKMSIKDYIEQMKSIQNKTLLFIDSEESIEEHYSNLVKILDDVKIKENKISLKQFLSFIIQISNNHHRKQNFFNKIEQILTIFNDSIKELFEKSEIFDLFKENKRILLFMIQNKTINVDKQFANKIQESKNNEKDYPEYFHKEINPFIYSQIHIDSSNFEENRKLGENENEICKLIRNDSIGEFITYVNKNDLPLNSKIKSSIYETNSLLLKNQNVSLIQYSAFFGSIQIFKYLYLNGVELTTTLWKYAIHGDNEEIFHILEEKNIFPNYKESEKCLKESIKSYQKDVENYISSNICKDITVDLSFILQNYNFDNIISDDINGQSFKTIFQCEYIDLAKFILESYNVDVNEKFSNQVLYQLFYSGIVKEYFNDISKHLLIFQYEVLMKFYHDLK